MDRNSFGPDMVPIESVGSYLERKINEDSFAARVLEPQEKRNMKMIEHMQECGMPEEAIEEARDAEAQSTDVLMCLVDELLLTGDYVVPRKLVDLIFQNATEAAVRELVQLLRELYYPDVQA